jgi:hypothetical protein
MRIQNVFTDSPSILCLGLAGKLATCGGSTQVVLGGPWPMSCC